MKKIILVFSGYSIESEVDRRIQLLIGKIDNLVLATKLRKRLDPAEVCEGILGLMASRMPDDDIERLYQLACDEQVQLAMSTLRAQEFVRDVEFAEYVNSSLKAASAELLGSWTTH